MMMMYNSYIEVLIPWLAEKNSEDIANIGDFHIKDSLKSFVYIFIPLYAISGLIGICGNFCLLISSLKIKIMTDPSYIFLANIASVGLITSTLVNLISMMMLMFDNWVFHHYFCWLFPMLQTFPVCFTIVTLCITIMERYIRAKVFLSKVKLGTIIFVVIFCILSWILSFIMVLPYIFYIQSIDLGKEIGKNYIGILQCSIILESDDIQKRHIVLLALILCICPIICSYFAFLTIFNREKYLTQKPYKLIQRSQNNNLLTNQDDFQIPLDETSYANLFYEKKLLRCLLSIIFIYLLFWLPTIILKVTHQFDYHLEGISELPANAIRLTAMLLSVLSTLVAPIAMHRFKIILKRKKSLKNILKEEML